MAMVDICLPLMITQPAQGETHTRRRHRRPNRRTAQNTLLLWVFYRILIKWAERPSVVALGAVSNPSGYFTFHYLHQLLKYISTPSLCSFKTGQVHVHTLISFTMQGSIWGPASSPPHSVSLTAAPPETGSSRNQFRVLLVRGSEITMAEIECQSICQIIKYFNSNES